MRDVIEKIKNAMSVAILPHKNEDPDALGSCFAFMKVMKSMGKEARVYVSEVPEKRLAFIGSEYEVYDASKTYSHDLCVCIDCGDLQRIGEREKLFNEIGASVNIDHHYTNTNFADANYVDGNASAAGEILYMLFGEMGVTIDKETAELLYIAICSDTGGFKYSNTTPRTMRICAELMEYGFDHSEVARLLFDRQSFAAARMCAEVTLSIKSYEDGKIKLVTIPDDLYEKYDIAVKDAPNMVDIPRRIEGTEVAVCIKHQDGDIRVNLRSNGDADVSKVAVKFGGGGHVRAAGCSIDAKTLEEAEEKIVAALKEVL